MKIFDERQQEIAKQINRDAELSHWKNWQWQLQNSIRDIDKFEELLGINFEQAEKVQLQKTTEKFPLSITPYYLSLIDTTDYKNDPIYKQAFPAVAELQIDDFEMRDPLDEDKDSPVPGITHRYPDRVLFQVSGVCSMYCRHCTRKRKVGDKDFVPSKAAIRQGIDYIKNTPAVRDVLLSGGDPFLLSDAYIDWILTEIQNIPHVEVIRIGTRTPVVLPYRITDQLVAVLKKHHPLWLNTHFNHPRELTASAREALRKLADAGIPLGNQSVLLAGINDNVTIMKKLVHKLVQNRVRPYYLYQCDLSEGLKHFRTPVAKGIEIMESLIGHTSGFAIPAYVIDAPGGGGKIRVAPTYLISSSPDRVVLRNFEGIITTYDEPTDYKDMFKDLDPNDLSTALKLEAATEYKAIGIEKLLSHHNDTISLIPENTERMERREEYNNG
jgi:lysine 2,3-aminomutase